MIATFTVSYITPIKWCGIDFIFYSLALQAILEMCLSNIKYEAIVMSKSHSACTLAIDAAKSPKYIV